MKIYFYFSKLPKNCLIVTENVYQRITNHLFTAIHNQKSIKITYPKLIPLFLTLPPNKTSQTPQLLAPKYNSTSRSRREAGIISGAASKPINY